MRARYGCAQCRAWADLEVHESWDPQDTATTSDLAPVPSDSGEGSPCSDRSAAACDAHPVTMKALTVNGNTWLSKRPMHRHDV